MFRKYTEEDLTDEALNGSSRESEVIDYKTEQETETIDYLSSRDQAKAQMDIDEDILWEGRPNIEEYNKNSFLVLKLMALIWCVIDIPMFVLFMAVFDSLLVRIIILFFFSIHLTPVWIFIATAINKKEIENSLYYIITNKRVIISYYKEVLSSYWDDIAKLKCIELDQSRDIGSFKFYYFDNYQNNRNTGFVERNAIIAVEGYNEICKIIHEVAPNLR